MQFRDEYELQETVAEWLEYSGYSVNREVSAGGGRADILTDNHLIEVKPVLTRAALLQAAGQLGIYRFAYPYLSPVIAGLTPSSNEGASYNTSIMLKNTQGIDVWYLDCVSDFLEFVASSQIEESYETYTTSYSHTSTYTPSYSGSSVDGFPGGCLVLIGGAIAIAVGMSGFSQNPIGRYSAFTYSSENPKARLYHEVTQDDVRGAIQSIHMLMWSAQECDRLFGKLLNDVLANRNQSPEALDLFNSAITTVEKDSSCRW